MAGLASLTVSTVRLVALATCLFAFLHPAQAQAPSFNCNRANTADTRTICRVPRLAELDQQLNQVYNAARGAVVDPARLLAEEKAWLATRAQCGERADCIESRMQVRIAQLNAVIAATVTIPRPAPGIGSVSGASAVAPTEAPSTPSYADRLAHPPAGLQSFVLDTVNGAPVVAGLRKPGERAFNLLLGLSFRPGMLEQGGSSGGITTQFAQTFLPRGGDLLGPYGDWAGANEFARQDNRDRFLANYGTALRSMAIDAPFRFAMVSGAFTLPEYDVGGRGFQMPDFGTPSLDARAGDDPVHLRGAEPAPRFLPIDQAGARQLVQALATQSPRDRSVRLVMEMVATSLDRPNLLVNVRRTRMALYDPTLSTVLFEFPNSQGATENNLARLAHPSGSVRAFNIPTLAGLPLLPASADWKQDFFLLLGMGAIDDPVWEQGHGAEIARRLLSEQARAETVTFGQWAGQDEFARARSRDAFFQRGLPAIKAAAPRLPIVFAYAQPGALGEYDPARRGFAVTGTKLNIGEDAGGGHLRFALPFAWPDGFWPLEPAEAERVLRALQPANRSSTGPMSSRPERYVTLVGVLEAGPVDGPSRTLTMRLRSMAVYTSDLRTRLYELPVQIDRAPAIQDPSARLHLAGPAKVDDLFLCAKAFQAEGGHPPSPVVSRCINAVLQRDNTSYARPEVLAATQPGDARWPFFPRNAIPDLATTGEAFSRYMLAYAAAIDEGTVLFTGSSANKQGGITRFASFLAGGNDKLALAAGASQGNQMIAMGSVYDRPVYGALPNSAALYGVVVPDAALAGLGGMTLNAETTGRVGPARAVMTESGRPAAIVMDVTPLSSSVSGGGRTVASRSLEDIPRLDANSFSRPAAIAATPSGPILFDGGLADLLAAAAVGDRLSPEAMTAMVVRRWIFENQRPQMIGDNNGGGTPYASPGATVWPARFFVPGKREPTVTEARELGPAFLDWARNAAPALPVTVALPGRIRLRRDQATARWSDMECLGGSTVSNTGYGPQMGGLNLRECELRSGSGGRGLLPSEQRTCFALAAAAAVVNDAVVIGGRCRPSPNGLGFSDPSSIAMLIPHDLTAPAWTFLGDQHDLLADAVLRLTSVALDSRAPQGWDMLSEALRPPPVGSSDRSGREHQEFIVFRTEFGGASWREPSGGEVARITPDQGGSVTSALARYQAQIDALAQAPHGPTRDVLGIRLGMGFEEAEALVRASMPVGRVLAGRRASDPAAKAGSIAAMTSGRLFIRNDGKELVAIYDEPPAAANRVMAVWRRVIVPSEIASAESLLRGLVEKYGKLQDERGNPIGSSLRWNDSGVTACAGMTSGGDRQQLMASWSDDGSGDPPMPNFGMMITKPLYGATWPSILARSDASWPPPENRQAQEKQVAECGATVTALVLDGRMTQTQSVGLDITLIDVGKYLAAFHDSQKALHGMGATATGADAPPIKF